MQSPFNVGDVVQLKSGGPLMTVEELQRDSLFCIWFDKTEKKTGSFNPATLNKDSGYE
ncbi:MAG: DUF2158 domain-containing protein [Brevundimonas sp.]|nr:DUF2158 domain-containing protein [Brevundimonas sp.]